MKKTKYKQVKLSPVELRTLQIIELSILIELDHICRKHNISYFLLSGTLLGAVRHKGFIPWDDDIDVGFMREDYERFCTIFAEEADTDKFFVQTWRTDKYYRWGYGKIRRLGTEYVRLGQEHMKYVTGISIDIFPYDTLPIDKITHKLMLDNTKSHDFGTRISFSLNYNAIPISKLGRWYRQSLFCGILRKILYSSVGKYQDKKPVMRFIYSILSFLPGGLISIIFDKCSQMYNHNPQYKYRIRQFGWTSTVIRPSIGWYTDKFLDLSEIEFEGYKFFAFSNYDWYLKNKYGSNYMQLPPPESRIGVAPVSKIDFGVVTNQLPQRLKDMLESYINLQPDKETLVYE